MQKELDMKYMRLAMDQGRLSLKRDLLPVGAVIVRDNCVLMQSHKIGIEHAHLDHAEKNGIEEWFAIHPNEKDLRGATIYTNLEPCLMCLGLMINVRISRIVYALEDSYGGGAGLLTHPFHLPPRHRNDHPSIEWHMALRAEARDLFREYFTTTKSLFWKNPENPLVKLCCGTPLPA